jgi:hypothetical protein
MTLPGAYPGRGRSTHDCRAAHHPSQLARGTSCGPANATHAQPLRRRTNAIVFPRNHTHSEPGPGPLCRVVEWHAPCDVALMMAPFQEAALTAFSLPEWVAAHAPAESAVGNKMVLDKGQLKVMVVWGPNERSDYHVEEGEVRHVLNLGSGWLKLGRAVWAVGTVWAGGAGALAMLAAFPCRHMPWAVVPLEPPPPLGRWRGGNSASGSALRVPTTPYPPTPPPTPNACPLRSCSTNSRATSRWRLWTRGSGDPCTSRRERCSCCRAGCPTPPGYAPGRLTPTPLPLRWTPPPLTHWQA